jgi:hypothetical protein
MHDHGLRRLGKRTRKNAELKVKQLNLEIALAELRLSLAERGDRKAILDLPNALSSVN